jgi:hypothetical protein
MAQVQTTASAQWIMEEEECTSDDLSFLLENFDATAPLEPSLVFDQGITLPTESTDQYFAQGFLFGDLAPDSSPQSSPVSSPQQFACESGSESSAVSSPQSFFGNLIEDVKPAAVPQYSFGNPSTYCTQNLVQLSHPVFSFAQTSHIQPLSNDQQPIINPKTENLNNPFAFGSVPFCATDNTVVAQLPTPPKVPNKVVKATKKRKLTTSGTSLHHFFFSHL